MWLWCFHEPFWHFWDYSCFKMTEIFFSPGPLAISSTSVWFSKPGVSWSWRPQSCMFYLFSCSNTDAVAELPLQFLQNAHSHSTQVLSAEKHVGWRPLKTRTGHSCSKLIILWMISAAGKILMNKLKFCTKHLKNKLNCLFSVDNYSPDFFFAIWTDCNS